MKLHSDRLVLRPWANGDRPALDTILMDSEVMSYSDSGVLTASQIDQWLLEQSCTTLSWAIEKNKTVIGYIKLSSARVTDSEYEIGFRFARKEWGNGYALEAAEVVLQLVDMPITAVVDPANSRSLRVLVKLGFRFVRPIMFAGYDHPDHLFLWAPG